MARDLFEELGVSQDQTGQTDLFEEYGISYEPQDRGILQNIASGYKRVRELPYDILSFISPEAAEMAASAPPVPFTPFSAIRRPSPNREQDSFEFLSESAPTQFVLGAGDALSNLPKKAYSSLTGAPYNPLTTGEGGFYEAGKFAGNVAPYFVPGPHQASIPARLAFDTGMGYLTTPEDPTGGALEAGAFSAALESLGGLGKVAGKVTGAINQKNVIDNLSSDIVKEFTKQKTQAGSLMGDAIKASKGAKVSSSLKNEISSMASDPALRNFSGATGTRKLMKDFLLKKNPTIEEMAKLKSQLSKDIMLIQKKSQDAITRDELGAMQSLKRFMNEAIPSSINQVSPGSGNMWAQGNEMYANIMESFKGEKAFKDLIEKGKTPSKQAMAKTARKIAKDAVGGADINPFIKEIMEGYTDKLNRSALAEAAYRGFGALGLGSINPVLGALAATKTLVPSVATQEAAEAILPKIYQPLRQTAKGALQYSEDYYE